jgi:hypothetical protein
MSFMSTFLVWSNILVVKCSFLFYVQVVVVVIEFASENSQP